MSATQLSPSLRTSKQQMWTASVALVGVTYFAVIVVALHFLRPDHNPIQRPTSEYAVGPYGWLMTSAFFSLSMATLALVSGLAYGVVRAARSRLGLGLLGLWAVGLLIAMSFPIDLDGGPPTMAGTIHRINGPLAFLSVTTGMILVSRRFKHDAQWHSFHRSAMILSLVMLPAFIATPVSLAAGLGLAGLCQRIALAAMVTWYMLTAMRLRAAGLGASPA